MSTHETTSQSLFHTPPVAAASGLLTQQVINQYEGDGGLWVPRDPTIAVWNFCSDERIVDEHSARHLAEQYPHITHASEGGVANYGQTTGAVKNVLTVGTKVHGPAFLTVIGGFKGALRMLTEGTTNAVQANVGFSVMPAAHSAANVEAAAFREANLPVIPGGFSAVGPDKTGCAFNEKLSAVPQLIGTDQTIQQVGADNLDVLTGGYFSEDHIQNLWTSNKRVATAMGAPNTSFTRSDYVTSGLPVMSLQGISHAPASESGVIINFDPTEISRPNNKMYRVDVAAAALAIRMALPPQLKLPADLLMAQFIADAVPVRAVLASNDISGDTTPDPNRLAIGSRGGTFAEALERIEAIERDDYRVAH